MKNFKPRARLLRLLGEELIGSQHLAIFELIKNAYDADADSVVVSIINTDDMKKTVISVLDNGCGMNLSTIENDWLEPGTDVKEKKLKENKLTPNYKRLPLGAKGVGRFASYKLGNTLTVNTKTKEDGEYQLIVDLNEALKNKYIQDVAVFLKKTPKSQERIKTDTGTEIIISNLHKPVEKKMVSSLSKQILSMQSPFEYWGYRNKKVINPFKIDFICKEFENEIKKTTIKDIIDNSMYRFKFSFEQGQLSYEYKFSPNIQLEKITSLKGRAEKEEIKNIITIDKKDPVKPKNFYSPLGKIEGVFYVYDFDGKIMQYYDNKQLLKAYTKDNSGVRIYRGGIRVYNYGESGDDWLELDQERIDDPSFAISNRLIIGGIELSPQTAIVLKEKTNREGFIDNEEYQKLKLTIKSIMSEFNKYRKVDKENLRLATDNKYKETIVNIENPISELKDALKKAQVPDIVAKKVVKVEKAYNQMRDIMLKSGLTGLNTSLAIHEIEKTLLRLKSAVNAKNTSLIKTEVDMALRLIDGISDLLKNDPIRKYKISEIIKDVINLSEDRFNRHNITLTCPILTKEQKDAEINIPKRMIQSSLMNLIDNSIYWMSVRWYLPEHQKNKRIYIGVEEVEGYPAIIVADTGTGFPKGDWAELFRPFITTKPMGVGMGLGLYYVKTIMDSIGGDVVICNPQELEMVGKLSKLDGAAVALIFKETA